MPQLQSSLLASLGLNPVCPSLLFIGDPQTGDAIPEAVTKVTNTEGVVNFLDLLPADLVNTITKFLQPQGHIAGSTSPPRLPGPFQKSCFPDSRPSESAFLHWFIPSQVQGSVFAFIEHREIPVSPFLQAVKVPLNSSNCSPQLGVICTLMENAVCAVSQVISDVIRHCCPSRAS